MPHHCPIVGCFAQIRPWALMCGRHWSMVPKPMQDSVTHYHRYFKGKPVHVKACQHAIEHVQDRIDTEQKAIEAKLPPKPVPKHALPYRDD